MSILVTGSNGFIGSHLVRWLRSANREVSTLDLSGNADYRVDIANREVVMDLPGFDVVYHLAAVSSPAAVAVNSATAYQTNVLGTRNIVERFGHRVIFAHTYLGRATLYGRQKGEAADIVRAGGGTVVRIANVYGPGSRSVVDKFIGAASRGEPLTIHGGGNQLCDFVHVDDVVAGLLGKKELAASGFLTSINQLADMIAGHIDGTVNVVHTDGIVADDLEVVAQTSGRPDRLRRYIAASIQKEERELCLEQA